MSRRLTLDLISITEASTLAVEGGFILFLDILHSICWTGSIQLRVTVAGARQSSSSWAVIRAITKCCFTWKSGKGSRVDKRNVGQLGGVGPCNGRRGMDGFLGH